VILQFKNERLAVQHSYQFVNNQPFWIFSCLIKGTFTKMAKGINKIFVLAALLLLPLTGFGQYYITPYAGTGYLALSDSDGDGGKAKYALLSTPTALCVDDSGYLYIVNGGYNNIKKVSLSTRIIKSIVGDGKAGYSGDGGPAKLAELNYAAGLAVDSTGNLYIAEYYNQTIRKVDPSGIITTYAGSCCSAGYRGDGGSRLSAMFNYPMGLAIDKKNNLFIADKNNNRIRKISPSGIVTTFAGQSSSGYSGDGGQATLAQLSQPTGVAVDRSGNVYIADNGNSVVRKVDTSGIITTLAGNDTSGYSGDGGLATSAKLANSYYAMSIATDDTGNIYIADANNYRIRKVSTSGIINTIAGTGNPGFTAGGPSSTAEFTGIYGIAVNHLSQVFISDAANNMVDKISTCYDVIKKQPKNDTVKIGDTAYFTVTLDSISLNPYTWYVWNTYDNGVWVNCNGWLYFDQHSATFKVYPVTADLNHARFMCICYPDGCPEVSNEVEIIIDNTGIAHVGNNSNIKVYPNPIGGQFYIEGAEIGTTIQLFNIVGQRVYTGIITNNKQTINTEDLEPGSYILQLIDKEGRKESMTVVKQ
jgi:hypothetical protein